MDDDGDDDEEEEGKERNFNKKVFSKISIPVKTAVLTDFNHLLGIVLCEVSWVCQIQHEASFKTKCSD